DAALVRREPARPLIEDCISRVMLSQPEGEIEIGPTVRGPERERTDDRAPGNPRVAPRPLEDHAPDPITLLRGERALRHCAAALRALATIVLNIRARLPCDPRSSSCSDALSSPNWMRERRVTYHLEMTSPEDLVPARPCHRL